MLGAIDIGQMVFFNLKLCTVQVGMAKISAKNGGDDVKPVYDFVSLCMKRM